MDGLRPGPVLDEERRVPSHPARRQDAGWAAAAAAAAALVFLLVRGSLIDDAFITLSYARNLAEHLHWGLTSFRTANSATSPLNVLVLGVATFVVRDAVWALGAVFVLLTAAQAGGLSRLARDLRLGPPTVASGVLLVLLSPLMLSVVGMEMTLAVTLLVWLAVAAAEGRILLFGVLTAAVVLTRVDLAVFPLVLLLGTGALRRGAVRVLLVAAAAVAPWYVFSWVVLGALLPDTLVIKTATGAGWGSWYFGNGPGLYRGAYPMATLLTAAPAAVGLAALLAWAASRAWRRPRWAGLGIGAALGVGALLHYLAYTLLAPPPYHWYYAPSVTALSLVAAVAAGTRSRGGGAPVRTVTGRSARLPATIAVTAGALVVVADLALALQRPLPWEQVPITTNWATAAEYRTVGEQLTRRLHGETVRSPGEIGALAYYCRCDIVDAFSDRGSIQPLIDEWVAESGPLVRLLLQVNFAHLDPVPAAEPTRALVWVPRGADPEQWHVHSSWRGPGALALQATQR